MYWSSLLRNNTRVRIILIVFADIWKERDNRSHFKRSRTSISISKKVRSLYAYIYINLIWPLWILLGIHKYVLREMHVYCDTSRDYSTRLQLHDRIIMELPQNGHVRFVFTQSATFLSARHYSRFRCGIDYRGRCDVSWSVTRGGSGKKRRETHTRGPLNGKLKACLRCSSLSVVQAR